MVKKLLWLFGLWGCLRLIAACCPDSEFDYTVFTAMDWAATELNTVLPDSASVEAGRFRLNIDFVLDVVAQRQAPLFNPLCATTCINRGLLGLKHDIIKLEISCDRDILGTAADTPIDLENKVRVYFDNFFDDARNERLLVSEWLDLMNTGGYRQFISDWYFEFQEMITQNEFLTFNITVEQEDGTVFSFRTLPVKVT